MAASKGTLLYVDEMMKKNIKKGTQTKSLYWIDYTDRKREREWAKKKKVGIQYICICRRKLLLIIILHLPML